LLVKTSLTGGIAEIAPLPKSKKSTREIGSIYGRMAINLRIWLATEKTFLKA
jgi:hypothetical protein